MNKLKIDKFKAFSEVVSLSLDGRKNLLLYGENGSGKSSIYEALKIIFFRECLQSHIKGNTQEEKEQLLRDFWSTYNNKITNQDFSILIDDVKHSEFDVSNYQVYMLSAEELPLRTKIDFKALLKKNYLGIQDVDKFCNDNFKLIEAEVNLALEFFKEKIQIVIEQQDSFVVKVIDQNRCISRNDELTRYFNEAKLNLIIILLILNSALKSRDIAKRGVLVLDDIISSLDASNRTFLFKYVLENFQNTQLLLFTHNVSFYNLVQYMINEIYKAANSWTFGNVFEIDNHHRVYLNSEVESVSTISTAFVELGQNPNQIAIDAIGNRARKRFEVMLYEYSKLVLIGGVEDSNKILDRILSSKSVYYKDKNTASDLIDEIHQLLTGENHNNLVDRLLKKIETYRREDFQAFKAVIRNLRLYQKVTMHPMSHGVEGLTPYTIKEIKNSIELLRKMETYLNSLVNTNVVTA